MTAPHRRPYPDRRTLGLWLVVALFSTFFAWFAVLRLLQHYAFRTHAYDLSLFDYALYYTWRGRFLWTPFVPGPNVLADHFSPALLLLLPIYLVDDGPLGLLVVQAFLVVASGIPLYLTARAALGHRALAAGLTVAYFGNPFLMRGLLYDFHLEMALPALFLTGLWLVEVTPRPAGGVAVLSLAMLVKEDVPIYVAAVALYFLLQGRRRVGLTLGVIALLYGAGVALVGFPALFRGEPPFALSAWSAYGATVPEILGYFATHPGTALAMFWSRSLLRLLATFGLLPLLAPAALLPAMPALFISLSGSPGQRELSAYYAAPLLPFLAWASVRALQRIRGWTARRPWVLPGLILLLLLANLGYLRTFTPTERDRRGRAVLAVVPRTASVATQGHLVPHLAKREHVYVIGWNWRREPVDYIVLDRERGAWPLPGGAVKRLARRLEHDRAYQAVLDDEAYVLFQRAPTAE